MYKHDLPFATVHRSQRGVMILTVISQRSSRGLFKHRRSALFDVQQPPRGARRIYRLGRRRRRRGDSTVCVSVPVQCVCRCDIGRKKPKRCIGCAFFSGGYRVIALHLILSETQSLPEGKKCILGHERFIDSLTKHISQGPFQGFQQRERQGWWWWGSY